MLKPMRNKYLPSWKVTSIKQIAMFIRGVTFSKNFRHTTSDVGLVPVVTTRAAQREGIEHDKLYFIPKKLVKRTEQFLKGNDIIISIANSLELVGRVTPVNRLDLGLTWGAFLGVLRVQSSEILPSFLYWYLMDSSTQNFFRRNARTTTNISNISSDTILSCTIPVPPMAEQKRIVRKIEELFGVIDRDIQRLTDTLEQLSQFRQSVLEKLLNNPVYPQISFNDGIEKIIGGSTPSKTVSAYYEGHIPFMTVKDMTSPRPQDTAWHITQEAVDNCSTHIIPANTLITATRVGLGKTVLMPFPVAINQDLKALVLNKNKVNTRFFEFILNAKTTEIISKSRGTTVKGITLEDFKSIKFYLPTLPEQQKIVDEIEKAFRSADKVQKAVQNALEEAKKLKQSILKKAFAGELVPQDPNDKPVNLPELKGQTK